MLFSQRIGMKSVKTIVQVDSIDNDLRNNLWNMLTIYLWSKMLVTRLKDDFAFNTLCNALWMKYFKQPIDTLPSYWSEAYQEIRNYFFKCKWYEVYDIIESIIDIGTDSFDTSEFTQTCNHILEQELSAYRIVNGKFIKTTSEQEINEIQEALEKTGPLKPVYTHLNTALDLMSDRKKPDYRNSIKESISAVEALCRLITDNPKATLGQALKIIKDKKVELHPALEKSFENIYGYTSDKDGIRHSLIDESNLRFIDAKFMLVLCAAFINFLIEKTAEAGISLE